MDRLWLCEVGAAADDDGPLRVARYDLFADMLFYAIELPGRQELAIGKIGHAVFVAADASEAFYVAVPRGEVFIPDGPGNGEAVAGGAVEFIRTPALCLSGP
jgi:hypothetical protein